MLAALKAAAKAAFTVIQNAPIGGILKVGVLIGSAIFAAWVLIQRAKKMHEAANQEESVEYYSPVDEILGKKNYATSVEDFDDMDPLAREICQKLNKMGKKRKKRKGVKVSKKKKKRIHDIFDGDFGTPRKHERENDEEAGPIVSLFDDDFEPDTEDDKQIQEEVEDRPKNHVGGLDAATELLIRQEINRERKRMKAERAARKRREKEATRETEPVKRSKKIPLLNREGLAEISRILDIWHKYGDERKEELVGRLEKIANDLGLSSIDELDEVVMQSVRQTQPNLF